MSMENNKIAVLIDAENVDPSYAEHIFTYANSLGNVCVREIYGSGISLNEWADPILTKSIHTNFTLRPNRFKNSSDICLVIGAMEILAMSRKGGNDAIDAVIIASSDSDFSPLAVHLRSAGIDVIGMGEAGRFNPMWPRACTDFILLETNAPLMRKREDEQPVVFADPAASSASAQPQKGGTPEKKEGAAAQPARNDQRGQGQSGKGRKSTASPKDGRKEQKASADKNDKNAEQKNEQKASADKNNGPKNEQKASADKNAGQQKEQNAAADKPAGSGNEQKAQEDKNAGLKKDPKKEKAKVAPNHKARIEIIRKLVAEQIEAHAGRIRSGELFRTLGSSPDYKYDQQRSRRNPMDYLVKQFGAWFDFAPGENGSSWISLKGSNGQEEKGEAAGAESAEAIIEATAEGKDEAKGEAATGKTAEAKDEAPAEEKAETTGEATAEKKAEAKGKAAAGKKAEAKGKASAEKKAEAKGEVSAEKKAGGKRKASTQKKAEAEPEAPAEEKAEEQSEGILWLINAGIPEKDAAQVAEVLAQCRNLRDSYNRLRQAFGNETGKQYQTLIKEASIKLG